jgi:hypothetical protein
MSGLGWAPGRSPVASTSIAASELGIAAEAILMLPGSLDACTEVLLSATEEARMLFSDTVSDAEDKVLLTYYKLVVVYERAQI